ncbi:MAG: secretin N-terminal domain-containing protein [Planctomycetota bacterium]
MEEAEKPRSRPGMRTFRVVFYAVLGLAVCTICRGAQEGESGVVLNSAFTLKHISAQQGKVFLDSLRLGETVSVMPEPSNSLLVTASVEDLSKIRVALRLVDSNEAFETVTIFEKDEMPDEVPGMDQISEAAGDSVIGSFKEPPLGKGDERAIVDIHNGDLIVIASASRAKKIASTVRRLSQGENADEEGKAALVEEEPNAGKPNHAGIMPAKTEEDVVAGIDINDIEGIFDELAVPAGQEEQASEVPSKGEPAEGIREPEIPKEEIQKDEGREGIEPTEAALVEEEPTDQEPYHIEIKPTQIDIPEASLELELDLPEKLAIIDLLDLMGKHLDLDYMYDEKLLKDKMVTLRIQDKIKLKELYGVLESVLKFSNLSMSRRGNLVTIVPSEQILDVDPVLITDGQAPAVGDVIVTRVFRLRFIDPSSAETLLKNMKLGASFQTVSETGTLIVTDYAFRMERMARLLELVDQPGEPREFKFRQLKYTLASVLAPKIMSLAEQMGTISITVAEKPAAAPQPPARGRRRPAPAPAPKAKPEEGARGGVYLDYDERTNRILIIGSEEEVEIVEHLIDAFDVPEQDLRTIKEYGIQYVDPYDVLDTLNELGVIKGIKGKPSGAAPKGGKSPEAAGAAGFEADEPQIAVLETTNSLLVNATPEQHAAIAMVVAYVDREAMEEAIPYVIYPLENQDPNNVKVVLDQLIEKTIKAQAADDKVAASKPEKREDVTVVADGGTFSLIVYGSRKNQEWVGSLIKSLDKRRPQVLIDVMLVEVTKTDTFNYDLELVSSLPDLDYTSGLVGGITGATTGSILTALEAAPDRNRFLDASSKQGNLKGFYGDRHIHALLTLMQEKDYGRVLAHPKILVNDNEDGTISADTTTYAARETTITSDIGAGQERTSVEFDEFVSGIELLIRPHISEGDLLRLEIEMSRSQQDPASGVKNQPPPDLTKNKVVTVVTVPDQSTIILGGVTTISQSKGGSKVPVFGDLPVIGGLFRTTNNSDTQARLYIFVKAYILRPTGSELPDLVRESGRNRAAFEKAEGTFQEYQDWPGFKQTPTEPEKILEYEDVAVPGKDSQKEAIKGDKLDSLDALAK